MKLIMTELSINHMISHIYDSFMTLPELAQTCLNNNNTVIKLHLNIYFDINYELAPE